MERAGRRAKAGSLSGLSGGLPGATPNVRRQRSLEWSGDRYSSSDEDRPQKPPQLDDRVFASLLAQATQQFDKSKPSKYAISPRSARILVEAMPVIAWKFFYVQLH
ncbi:unnamed protein product [Euphydryas editha]|uniref:Uncharacterized protein n=1 Tax=Euphydryas editha TaxID=104508 RepID=A0AAU9TYT4_EUPED|nr:unnamed protein product [Euphydryas editha]